MDEWVSERDVRRCFCVAGEGEISWIDRQKGSSSPNNLYTASVLPLQSNLSIGVSHMKDKSNDSLHEHPAFDI